MAKGENIFKRKDGRWEARYIKGREPSGKIRYGYCYGKSYKEAKEKVNRCMLEQLSESQKCEEKQFKECCDEWLSIKQSGLRPSTVIKYSNIIEKHIKPYLGECSVSDIDGRKIADFTNELLTVTGLAPKTVKDILILLHSIIEYAQTQQYGERRVIEVNYPAVPYREMRVLSQSEQERFIDFLKNDMNACKFGILFALLTGLRIGEICALRWERVSIADASVQVLSSMQRLKAGDNDESKTSIVIGPPKSVKSMRTIPLTEYTAELCKRMDPGNPSAFLLTGTEKYMEPRALQYRLSKYIEECNLEGVHFHTLRHTFATRAVEVGFDIKSLSEIMGHSSTKTTLEEYVHSSLEHKRTNMNKLSAVGL